MTLRIWVIQSKRSSQAKGWVGRPEKWTGLFLIEVTCGLEQTLFKSYYGIPYFFVSFGEREIALSLLESQPMPVVSKITSLKFPADLPGTSHQGLRFMHCIWHNTSIVRQHLTSSWDTSFFLNVLEMRHQWWSLNSESSY